MDREQFIRECEDASERVRVHGVAGGDELQEELRHVYLKMAQLAVILGGESA